MELRKNISSFPPRGLRKADISFTLTNTVHKWLCPAISSIDEQILDQIRRSDTLDVIDGGFCGTKMVNEFLSGIFE